MLKSKKCIFMILIMIFCLFNSGCMVNDLSPQIQLSTIDGAVNPDFSKIEKTSQPYDNDFIQLLQQFSVESSKMIISPSMENIVISPMSYYMSLALLAEMTNGACLEEIITALGMPSLDYIRSNTKKLFETHFDIEDEHANVMMGNSVWIDEGFTVKEQLLHDLAQYFYVLSYHGDLQSLTTAEKIKTWVDSVTGKLIDSPVNEYLASPGAVLMLYSTLFLKAGWSKELDPASMKPFTLEDGSTVEADFMYSEKGEMAFLTNDFSVLQKSFSNGYKMRFVLPTEGSTPFDLINNQATLLNLMNINKPTDGVQIAQASAYLPKFGFRYDVNLIVPTSKLGINEIFSSFNTGFKKVTDGYDLMVTDYKQNSYFEIDEKGAKAASVTSIEVSVTSVNPKPLITLTFDRPFLFMIVDQQNLPLFIGVLNNPTQKK